MSSDRDIWTVSRLTQATQQLLEGHFSLLWLEGELSNFKSYASGHWYFSLKDEQSQVRGVMFRGANQKVGFQPRDGQQVRVRVQVSLYAPSGSFQVQVLQMQEAGAGALLLQLEKLKQKLAAEGLFASERKKSLPRLPRQVGVITSASGAALRDILTVLKRRCPQLPVVIYPASVQGQAAPGELVQALQLAITRAECDVLIIGRGGGSLEDLFCFNDEALTRAVAACPLPIISAVGHEVDFSLTDFAADVRAPTPSAAAELVCPDMTEWRQQWQQWQGRLDRAAVRSLNDRQARLNQLSQRLISPKRLLLQQQQRLDELQGRLQSSLRQHNARQTDNLRHLDQRLLAKRPDKLLQQQQLRVHEISARLTRQMTLTLTSKHDRLIPLEHRLQMASPTHLLDRGYSLTRLASDHTLVRSDTPLPTGTQLVTHLAGNRQVNSKITD